MKSLPPESLGHVLELLPELEESYEHEEWDKATRIVGEIEEGLKKAISSTADNTGIEFSSSLKGLNYGIAQKNEELTERAFIRLNNQIFQYASHFQYDTHPLFSIITRYIDEEAVEAAAEGNFDEVMSELREIASILRNSKDIFINNGVTEKEIQGFHEKLQSAVIAARNKDKKAVLESLDSAKQYFSKISS
jgi:predicted subunit of tRNA(5-methylaminomethyl-2-thiouridylate) methyltransferase